MCYERIKDGIIPACAEACPVEAITFGKKSELLKAAKLRIWSNPDKYLDHVMENMRQEELVGCTYLIQISQSLDSQKA